jgi:hypothetical protein
MFVGIIPGKPSRDFTRPLGSSRGLKGLLNMLNARLSHERGRMFHALNLFFVLFC